MKSKPAPKTTEPIVISTASVTHQKMQAICDIAAAIRKLSAALDSVHTDVTVSNCTFHGGTVEIREAK